MKRLYAILSTLIVPVTMCMAQLPADQVTFPVTSIATNLSGQAITNIVNTDAAWGKVDAIKLTFTGTGSYAIVVYDADETLLTVTQTATQAWYRVRSQVCDVNGATISTNTPAFQTAKFLAVGDKYNLSIVKTMPTNVITCTAKIKLDTH